MLNVFRRPLYLRETFEQMDIIGVGSLVITMLTGFFTGAVLALQTSNTLSSFGAVGYTGQLVSVSLVRELGPVLTAIVVAGRSGAGLASEIATMTVSEEIDALRALGFSPFRWLVVPRCIALVLAVPMLTWIGDVLALVGGLAATMALTDMTPRAYVLATTNAITAEHFLAGLAKTPFLALAIGLIACGQGLAEADFVTFGTRAGFLAANVDPHGRELVQITKS